MTAHVRLFTRDNPASLATREALARPATFDAEHNTIEATIATTTRVRRRDQRGDYLEILDPAGLDLAATRGASVLNAHNRSGLDQIVGTVDDVWVAGDEVRARIRFSDRDEVRRFVDDIRNGIIRFLSVGYEVSEYRDGTESGQRTRTATKWAAREVSFVPVAADPRSRTRNLPPPTGQRAEANRQIRMLGERAGVSADVVNNLIDRGVSVGEAREEILFEMQTRSMTNVHSAHNRQTLDNPQTFIRAAGAALHHRVAPTSQVSGPARQFVGMTIPDHARECLRRMGENVTGLGGPELVTRALHTTSDFPLILADAVNRTLRQSYQAAPSGVRALARQTTAADFRAKHRLQLDSSGFTLEKVGEHGEFKSGTMAEGEETYRVETFGRIFGITRAALVNDDISAFSDLSRRLGQAAAAFEAQHLVDLLTSQSGLGPDMSDGNPLFDATHGNVSTSGAVPSETALKAARLAMRKQTGLGGGLIDVTPFAVLVPSDLETDTEKLLTTIQAMSTADVNPFSALRLIVEPRLSDAYRWYVVANPAVADGLECAYLAGGEGPQVESQAGFKVDGVEIRVRLDYGAGFVDHRSWYSNAGH